MGIQGLLPLLSSIHTPIDLSEFKGQCIAGAFSEMELNIKWMPMFGCIKELMLVLLNLRKIYQPPSGFIS